MTDWHFVAADVDGTPRGELTAATARTVTFPLYAACTAAFTIDGRHPEATMLQELVTDLLVYRDAELMFRGRLGSSTDSLDADKHTTTFSAVDYRGMLHRRKTFGPQTYTGWDLADIGWDMIDLTQHRVIIPGGEMRITRGDNGAQGIGTVRDHEVKDGAWVDGAIDELANVWGGFQWAIDPQLRFQAWASRGRNLADFAIQHTPSGGNVTKIDRAVDTSQYGNTVVATGAEGLMAAYRFAPDLAARPEGRIEWQESVTDRTTQEMVDGAAEAALAWHGNITPAYKATLSAGVWAPDIINVGDTASIRIQSGRLNVDTTDRVFEVGVAISDEGNETVDLTFGQVRRDLLTFFRAVPARLDRLERQ